jgi:hypothetical protein
MQWPTIEQISAMTPLPAGYRFELLTRADMGPLIEAIREWFPSVSVGAASCYLTEQFYLDKVVIDDETDKDVIALLIKKGDELVGMGSWERESAAMTLYARLVSSPPRIGEPGWLSWRWNTERGWDAPWAQDSSTHWPR